MATNNPRPLTDEIRAKGQVPVPPPPPPPSELFRPPRNREEELQARVEMLEGILLGYEQWEANLILKANWESTREGLPALTYPLYDELMALQARRNEALGRGMYRQR